MRERGERARRRVGEEGRRKRVVRGRKRRVKEGKREGSGGGKGELEESGGECGRGGGLWREETEGFGEGVRRVGWGEGEGVRWRVG